ncbi:MAG: hypothetical protein IE921_17980 [Rhodobacteraceae bacterium]|nr:hypothetical protein [Paracoccaceae bacterium]
MHNLQGNLTLRRGAAGGPSSDELGAVTALLVSSLGDFFFFFFVFFFFFLATWLLESVLSPGEVEDEDVETGEEGDGSTFEST